ncbi:MAG: hypothetical protein ABI261_07065 [Ginsengibacter sp.]
MTFLKYNQFEQEWNLCKNKLEHFKQENVLLKYRLSEMVDNNEGSKFLQLAEYFQNELLITDEKLKKLFHKHEEFSNKHLDPENEKTLSEQIISDYKGLIKEIIQFEKKFVKFKKEFNGEMLENTRH